MPSTCCTSEGTKAKSKSKTRSPTGRRSSIEGGGGNGGRTSGSTNKNAANKSSNNRDFMIYHEIVARSSSSSSELRLIGWMTRWSCRSVTLLPMPDLLHIVIGATWDLIFSLNELIGGRRYTALAGGVF